MEIERGGVYWHDFGVPSDSRQAGLRPALVVQSDALNRIRGYALTVVVPLTSRERAAATYVKIEPSERNGLRNVSWAICNQVYTIPKAELIDKAGRVSQEVLGAVDLALMITLGVQGGRRQTRDDSA
jgi:mRNA interferase MazF